MKKIVVLFGILFVSCTVKQGTYFEMEKLLFSKDTLRGTLLPEYVVANNPVTRIFHTPYGIICCTNIENNVIQLLDLSTGMQKATAGHLGRGPNEMLSSVGMQFDYETNFFYCYDNMMKKLVAFEVGKDTIIQMDEITFKRAYSTLQNLSDSVFVGLSFVPYQSLELLDCNADVFFSTPYKIINHSDLDYEKKYFNSGFAMSPNKKYIATCDSHFSSVQLYALSKESLSSIWEKMLFEPQYYIENQWIKLRDHHPMGFKTIVLTDHYIYLPTHSMEAMEYRDRDKAPLKYTNLLVLNYQGNVVKSLVLDSNFFGFTVTPDDRDLYAFVDDPDTYIIKYQISR